MLGSFVVSANPDLGRFYLDAFRYEFYSEYLLQSAMITEVCLGLFMILSTALLVSKSNEGLFVYTVSDRKSKFLFLTTRIAAGLLLNVTTVVFVIIFYLLVLKIMTPFTYDFMSIIKIFGLISFKIIFFQLLVFLLQGYSNNFLLVIIPIGLFWYEQTIDLLADNISDVQLAILQIVPEFTYENTVISIYHDFQQYLLIYGLFFIVSYFISSVKDHG